MRRRPFLHLAVGALATAGCVGTSDTPVESGSGATTSGDATPDEGTEMAVSDGGPYSLESVGTFEYVIRLNDLGDDPSGAVTEFSELIDREREVVETALAEGYRTDDPQEWLVKFASATPVVRREGAYYRLEHTFPTYEVTADAVAEADVDGAVATYEEYEAAVTRDGYVMSGLLRIARREGLELNYVWPALREFFDEYAAVRYRGDVVSFSVAVEDPGPPYEIEGEEISVSEAVDGSVWDASEASEETRELVRRAGDARGAHGFDRAPDGFLEALRSHRYVHLDGTFYTTYVETRESVPLAVSAELADGRLELAARNEGDEELRVTSGAPRPFGVVRCHPEGDSETSHLLWTDAYEESSHVRTEGREIEVVDSIGLVTTLAPGEAASETYEVPADLAPGEYVVEESLGVESSAEGGEDGENVEKGETSGSSTVQYRVVFSVNG